MTEPNVKSISECLSRTFDVRKQALRELFPEAVKEGAINFDIIKNLVGESDDRRELYDFTWFGKQDAALSLNSKSEFALKPVRDQSVNWNDTKNIFIEGNNLEVLTILEESYSGRVKVIYIDPPYNTGNNDFVYPDKFSQRKRQYQLRTKQIDEEGNAQTTSRDRTGQTHSNWLRMMFPRLYRARGLLKDDGLIFVSIDDNEAHHLRLLMDEIFGAENFLATMTWRGMHTKRNSSKDFSKNTEFVLAFAKDKSRLISTCKDTWLRYLKVDKRANYTHDDHDGKGTYKLDPLHARNYYKRYRHTFRNGVEWEASSGNYPRYSQRELDKMEVQGELHFGGKEPKAKRYLARVQKGVPPDTLIPSELVGFSKNGSSHLNSLMGGKYFDQPKPWELISYLLSIERPIDAESEEEHIVLDFFAGSCTTAEAVLRLNCEDGRKRKFIMVELPFATDFDEYDTIADVGKDRIRLVIQRLNADCHGDLGFRTFKLVESSILEFEGMSSGTTTSEDYVEQMELNFPDLLVPGWRVEDVIAEVAVKYLGLSLTYKVEPVTSSPGQNIFKVYDDDTGQDFHICLDDNVTFSALKQLGLGSDDTIVFRDSAVTDETVANLGYTCSVIIV